MSACPFNRRCPVPAACDFCERAAEQRADDHDHRGHRADEAAAVAENMREASWL